ncbi:MAG: hypothetical protein ACRDMJ_08470, partial [Solirubrobacteraceae bacterium]
MKAASCLRAAWPALLAAGAAEGARRLLAPGPPPLAPARINMGEHFSVEQIERGRRYARPQRALALVRSGLDLALLTAVARRPPGPLARGRSLGAVAAAGAGLSAALTAQSVPL